MYPSCFIITCNVHFWMTMLHFFLSKMQVLFMWSRTKGLFSFIIAVFSSIVALTTLIATLAADLDVFGVSLGVKLGFFKWELNNLFNRASNSFEVIAIGDGCKMPSPSKLYFFKFEKSKFNKNNLKTCPSSNPIYLNPTLIHQVFKWKLEFIERNEKKIWNPITFPLAIFQRKTQQQTQTKTCIISQLRWAQKIQNLIWIHKIVFPSHNLTFFSATKHTLSKPNLKQKTIQANNMQKIQSQLF